MACGCNKSKARNKKNLVKSNKKTLVKRTMPLVTIRKRISGAKKRATKK